MPVRPAKSGTLDVLGGPDRWWGLDGWAAAMLARAMLALAMPSLLSGEFQVGELVPARGDTCSCHSLDGVGGAGTQWMRAGMLLDSPHPPQQMCGA